MGEIERTYHHMPEQYIILEEYDFGWSNEAVQRVINLWQKETDLNTIAKKVRPGKHGLVETTLLIMDLLDKGKIEPRKIPIEIGGVQ